MIAGEEGSEVKSVTEGGKLFARWSLKMPLVVDKGELFIEEGLASVD